MVPQSPTRLSTVGNMSFFKTPFSESLKFHILGFLIMWESSLIQPSTRILSRQVSSSLASDSPYIAELLLHHSDGLKVCRVVEGVTSEQQELDEVPCDVSPGHVKPARQVGEAEPLIHRTYVGHSITTVDYNTCQ